jgi:penicillin-binding protein 2
MLSIDKDSRRLRGSLRTLQVVVGIILLIYLGRLFQLQILEYDTYNPISQRNSVRQEVINPSRGLILDRFGKIMVENAPVYSLYITPSIFDTSRISLLAELMELSDSTIRAGIQVARRYSLHRSSRLFSEVEFDKFTRIEENIWRLPGITHQIESKRVYPSGVKASHTLGYLREITRQEFRESEVYRLGDKSGRSGLEQVYERVLRGNAGIEFRRVNAYGQGIGAFNNGDLDIEPDKGDNLHTTLDLDLQLLAERLMVNKAGGLVAMDPNTGEILAIVSAPDYDISRLSGRLDRDYWLQLNTDTLRPLFNRAISSREPPGSTFKPIMGLVGLRLGLITPETVVHCNGGYFRGRLYRCTARHGNQNLEEAVKNSCNTYFFSLMNRIVQDIGLNDWHAMIQRLGFGRLNSIDLPSEGTGILPDSTQMDRLLGRNRWGLGDQISLGVGQGLVSASPLQVAVSTAHIANGGYWVQPHLVRAVEHENGEIDVKVPLKTRIEWIRDADLEPVRKGMRRAVQEGSGRFYANPTNVPTAGKTGTAQNPRGRDHGWFVGYAPYDNPKIVVAVIVENGGFGSVSAAPVASLLMEYYLTREIAPNRQRVVDLMLNFVPRSSDVVR